MGNSAFNEVMGFYVKATAAEVLAGTDDTKFVTPLGITPILPNRNVIINGAMDIWQRGTATLTNPVTATYLVDRFITGHSLGDGTYNILNSAETPVADFPFSNSLEIDVTHIETAVAAGEYVRIQYRIEGYDFKRIHGKTCTLSFWVKAIKTGIYCVAFTNSALDKAYVHEYTVNQASTWEKKTVTLTFNAGGTWLFTNGIGCHITFMIMCGSTRQIATANKDTWQSGNYAATDAIVNGLDSTNNKFWLTGVQLELGAVATPFEFESYSTTLQKCMRYYERITPGIAHSAIAAGYTSTTTAASFLLKFSVPKRATPTFDKSSVSDFTVLDTSAGFVASTAISMSFASPDRCGLDLSVASGLTAGRAVILCGENNTTHWIDFAAEL
jgi:hypothetical protein